MLVQPGLGQRMAGKTFWRLPCKGRVFAEGRVQQAIHGLRGQLVHNALGQRGGIGGKALAPPGAPPRQKAHGLFRRCPVPGLQPPQHMAGVRRGHAGQHHQPARHQPFQRRHLQPRGQGRAHRHRCRDPCQHARFAWRQPARLPAHRNHKAPVHLAHRIGRQPAVQRLMHHGRMVHGQQRDGDQTARAKAQAPVQTLGPQMHLAVAAQPGGAHGHRFDHRAVGANARALRIDLGQAAAQQGDIGGRATDIRHQRIGFARQPARAHNAGGRAGQDRLNGALAHHRCRNQRAIAAHHHQGRINADHCQMTLAGGDQPVDHADQPGVQHRRQRPFRPVELRGKFVRTGHGPPGHPADQGAGRHLVGRIAGGKAGCHGKAHHLIRQTRHGSFQRLQIQRAGFLPGMAMPTGQPDHRIAAQRLGQTAPVQIAVIEADEDQRNPAALAFDQRIGGQRGGQRHQPHLARRNPGPGQRRIHRTPDAQRQIAARGQRLGRADHPVCRLVHDHRIGIGAACVNTQKIRHSAPRPARPFRLPSH